MKDILMGCLTPIIIVGLVLFGGSLWGRFLLNYALINISGHSLPGDFIYSIISIPLIAVSFWVDIVLLLLKAAGVHTPLLHMG